MYAQPEAWHRLCGRFAAVMGDYLKAQVEAGAQALQVFDSWAGALGRSRLPRVRAAAYARGSSRRLRGRRRPGDPLRRRHDGASCPTSPRAGGDVIGVDWRLPLDEAWTDPGTPIAASRAISIPRCCSAPSIACSPRRTTCCARGRPSGPHLQPGTRHPADDAASSTCRRSRVTCTRSRCRRPPHRNGAGSAPLMPAIDRDSMPDTSSVSSLAAASADYRPRTSSIAAACRSRCSKRPLAWAG